MSGESIARLRAVFKQAAVKAAWPGSMVASPMNFAYRTVESLGENLVKAPLITGGALMAGGLGLGALGAKALNLGDRQLREDLRDIHAAEREATYMRLAHRLAMARELADRRNGVGLAPSRRAV